jgi:hypothetical protein
MWLIAITIAMMGSALQAQNKIEAPKDFMLTSYQDGFGDKNYVLQAYWSEARGSNVEGYNVYKVVKSNGTSELELHESVQKNDEKFYVRDYKGFSKGDIITLVVKAFKYENRKMIESEESKRQTITIGEYEDTTGYNNFYFEVEFPKRPLVIGETKSFKIKTYNANNCAVKFDFVTSPFVDASAYTYSFNETTNELSITALKTGGVYLEITGTIDCEKKGIFRTIFSSNIIEKPENSDLFFARPIPEVNEVASGHSLVFDYTAFAKNPTCAVRYEVVETDMDIIKSMAELENGGNTNAGGYFDDSYGALYFTSDKALKTEEVPGGQRTGYVVIRAFVDGCDTNLSITTKTKFVLIKQDDQWGENLVTIQVVQEDGTPAKMGQITAFVTDLNYADIRGGFPLYTSALNDNGTAVMQIPADVDFTFFYQNEYYGEWYEDAETIESARFMRFSKNDTASIKMIVDNYKAPVLSKTTGKVTNESGDAVSAYVIFFPEETLFGGVPTDNFNNQPIYATTNWDGSYSADLIENKNYIAAAFRMDDFEAKDVWFYNQVRTPMEAEIISGSIVNENINFTFSSADLKQFSIKGRVAGDKNDSPIVSTISAMKVDGSLFDLFNSFNLTTMTDDNGMFEMQYVKEGKYILFSMPNDRHYLPGYMVDNGLATQEWKKATLADVNGLNNGRYIIIHEKLDKATGAGEVKGIVSGKRGVFGKKDDNLGSMKSMAGVMVVAQDSKGKNHTHATTNSKGEYSLKGLVPGTYTIKTNAMGYTTNISTVTIDYNNNANVIKNITLDGATSVEESEIRVNEVKLFPVPAVNNVNVKFESTVAGNASVRLIDATGATIVTKAISINSGLNQTDFDLSNVANGSYIITIETNERTFNSAFTVAK